MNFLSPLKIILILFLLSFYSLSSAPSIIMSNPVLCDCESIILSTDQDFESYEWSNSETSAQIIVNSPGKYWLIATDDLGKKHYSDTVDIKEVKCPEPEIIADSILCKGQDLVLDLNKGFESYHWSNGEDTKSIIINKAGEYQVTVIDKNNCKGNASIQISEFNLESLSINEFDFDDVVINGKKRSNQIIQNLTKSNISIDTIKFLHHEDVFTVDTDPNIPFTLSIESYFDLEVKFNPQNEMIYYDTMLIIVNEPCLDTLRLACSGNGIKKEIFAEVYLPDETFNIDDEEIRLVLRARITNDQNALFKRMDIKARIVFDFDFILPKGLSNGNITRNEIVDSDRIIEIEILNFTPAGRDAYLTEILATPLVGKDRTSPLKIDSIWWSDDEIKVSKKDGSLEILRGACFHDYRYFRKEIKTEIEIFPQPANTSINVNISHFAPNTCFIKIVDLQGDVLHEQNWNSSVDGKNVINEIKNFQIDISNFANAKYYLIFANQFEQYSKEFVISK